MVPAGLPVARWPGPLPAPIPELLLYAVATPQTTQRDTARQRVRDALRRMLGELLGCPPAAVPLLDTAGQALRLSGAAAGIGLSVSHEPGLSLLAIHRHGPVGIDLLQLPANPLWEDEIPLLARDYLGPETTERLFARPLAERTAAFAAAWTAHEAALKYLGEGLREWTPEMRTPEMQRRLAGCRVEALALPAGYVGSVALAA